MASGGEWAARTYTGGSENPAAWDDLIKVFDAIFGKDTQSLKTYPETLHHVSASWQDGKGVTHEVTSLEELREAYEKELTYRLSFYGWRQGGRQCEFSYFPGLTPPTAVASLQASPTNVEEMLEVVRATFPIQQQFVFLSWSGARAKAIAAALVPIISDRLPVGAEVFFSDTDIIPDDDPLKIMLNDRLLASAIEHLGGQSPSKLTDEERETLDKAAETLDT